MLPGDAPAVTLQYSPILWVFRHQKQHIPLGYLGHISTHRSLKKEGHLSPEFTFGEKVNF